MSKPANKSIKSKIILLASHEKKGKEKEEFSFYCLTLNEHNGKDPLMNDCYFEHILTVLTAFDQGAMVPSSVSY